MFSSDGMLCSEISSIRYLLLSILLDWRTVSFVCFEGRYELQDAGLSPRRALTKFGLGWVCSETKIQSGL